MATVAHLIADSFGQAISKHGERLRLTQKGNVLLEAPLLHLEMVLILSEGVSLSSNVVAECCERGIPIFFLDGEGAAYGAIYAAGLSGAVATRRAQLAAYTDQRGAHVALQIAASKIANQAAALRYMAKNYRQDDPDRHQALNSAAQALMRIAAELKPLDRLGQTADTVRTPILSAEAAAARRYWEALQRLVPSEYSWEGREGRGAKDPVNSLLNYGYGILYGQVERALVLAGLDPYGGFIHTDRPNKPSLVLDLIEEFRAFAVDRVVFGLVNRRFTVKQDEDGLLAPETRRTFAEKILEHLETAVRYEGARYPLRALIQRQARQLAAFLRGERERYEGFSASW